MTTLSRKDRDWVGLWYAIAREERGVNDIMVFLRTDFRTGQVRRFEMSHEKMDGLGALVHWLSEEGHVISKVPEGRVQRPKNLWERFRILRAFLRASKNRTMQWLRWVPEAAATPNEIVLTALSREETEALNDFAREKKCSVNALLMSELSRVLGGALVKPGQTFPWLFPVNMRGAVALANPFANQSSAVGVECSSVSSMAEIHDNMRDQLKAGVYWGTWWTLQLGRIVGVRGMRWLSNMRAEKNHWMGTFSNLGVWPPQNMNPNDSYGDSEVAWIPSPPGTLNFPIGFACIQWFGRLTYTLKIHPAVCAGGFERVKELESEFTRSLKAKIATRRSSLKLPELPSPLL
jgi:hypothetical protein